MELGCIGPFRCTVHIEAAGAILSTLRIGASCESTWLPT